MHSPTARRLALLLLLTVSQSCSALPPDGGPAPGPGTKDDSGWIGSSAYEVDVIVRGEVEHTLETCDEFEPHCDAFEALATDPVLQESLVDLQVRFAKNQTELVGYYIGQMLESVRVTGVQTQGATTTLTYEARVEMLRPSDDPVPALSEIEPRQLSVRLPTDPVNMYRRYDKRCAEQEDSVADYNYFYYFDPDRSECHAPLTTSTIEIVEVFPRAKAYPEYDQLMKSRADGTVGFAAAILPDSGDEDPMSRFNAHKRMLEGTLGLTGALAEDQSHIHYEMREGRIRIDIDLYDPTHSWFSDSFHAALGRSELVHYNGHSQYGQRDLLSVSSAYADFYQIVSMHSCRSWAYYARQVFEAKGATADPRGWERADVVSTGESSYPTDSAPTLGVLLRNLREGLVAVDQSRPAEAPTWDDVSHEMNAITHGIYYGVAGARTNRWKP